jgi:hypothetical protein
MTDKVDTTRVELAENVSSHRPNVLYEFDDNKIVDLSAVKNNPDVEVNLKLAIDGHVSSYPSYFVSFCFNDAVIIADSFGASAVR